MKACLLVLLGFVYALFSSSANAQNLTPLKPGDPIVIDLKVPAEDATNVSAKMNVSKQGTIKVAYIEREISVAGLNTTEVARRIEQAYRAAEIYTAPTVVVTSSTPNDYIPHIVSVGGEVRSPRGDVPVRDGMRLYQAIMSCGGPTEFADMRKVKLIRGTRQTIFDMRKLDPSGSNNPVVQDGDTIHIPQD